VGKLEDGKDGAPGSSGSQGPQGIQGIQGEKGADGSSCWTVESSDPEHDYEIWCGWPSSSSFTGNYLDNGAPSSAGSGSSGTSVSCWTANDPEDSAYINIVCGPNSSDSKASSRIAKAYCLGVPYDPELEVCQTNGTLELQFIQMVFVKGGTFTMGCTKGQNPCYADASPTHSVTLDDFYIGKYEVTRKQWEAVMKANPSSKTCGEDCPVESVSWNDIQTFLTALNTQTGKNYRLPTEAEWEFAARGGNAGIEDDYLYAGSDAIDDVAWYKDNSDGTPHPVGRKTPNQLGIHDMSGNVREWVSDRYGSYSSESVTNPSGPGEGSDNRVVRGGSWNYGAVNTRVSFRHYIDPDYGDYNDGFRLALSPSSSSVSQASQAGVD
jgi:hypothetical protein